MLASPLFPPRAYPSNSIALIFAPYLELIFLLSVKRVLFSLLKALFQLWNGWAFPRILESPLDFLLSVAKLVHIRLAGPDLIHVP